MKDTILDDILNKLTNIEKKIIRLETLSDLRDNHIEKHESAIKDINVKVEDLSKSEFGRKAVAKYVSALGVFLTLLFVAMQVYFDYQNKQDQEREAYALSVPNPEQEQKISDLEAKLESLNKKNQGVP